MYSVFRITGQPNGSDIPGTIDALKASIDVERPEAATDRRGGDGFAVVISSSSEWDDHLRLLTSFVSTFADQIAEATRLGVGVQQMGCPVAE